jgi:hypothetical protein
MLRESPSNTTPPQFRPGRRAVSLGGRDLVRIVGQTGLSMPVVISPAAEDVDLAAWIGEHQDHLRELLSKRGAIMFRGFDSTTAEQLERLSLAMSPEMLNYVYGSTPRQRATDKVYTSTEYPADQQIPMHNEMSYARRWPMKLWFQCSLAAPVGGQTPIADSRGVLARIPVAIREKFTRLGVTYVRNYGAGLDLPWEDVFETRDRAVVETFCHESGISFSWQGADRLRTWQRCQATIAHPWTGEQVWFNQAHLFHVSSHEPEVRAALEASVDELPRNAVYGDGSPIEDDVLDEVRAAFTAELVVEPWATGDVMLLDNMLMAHGRMPYSGPRKILVSMAEQHISDQIEG